MVEILLFYIDIYLYYYCFCYYQFYCYYNYISFIIVHSRSQEQHTDVPGVLCDSNVDRSSNIRRPDSSL